MTAATKTTNLFYVMPFILHNKENKVRTYAFIDPGSGLTIVFQKTADKLRLQKETLQQLVFEGANGTDTKACYTTSTEKPKFRSRQTLRPQTDIRCGKHKIAKAEGPPGDIARKLDHLRQVNMPNLDNLS